MIDFIITIIGLIGSVISIYLFIIDKKIKKHVKYIIGGISIFICVILIMLLFYEKYKISINEENEYEIFIDEENEFQISYPNNWLIDQEISTDTEIYIGNSAALNNDSNPKRGMGIRVLERNQLEETFWEDYEDCTINNKTFKTYSVMNYDRYIVGYIFIKNDKIFWFVFGVEPGADRIESDPIFDKIINTLYIYDD